MTAKQNTGVYAPDGSLYITLTDGAGNLCANIGSSTGVTFANLPASPTAGMTAYVTDSNTVVWGATVAGSSTNKILAFYNGTNWTVVGK